MNHDRHNRNIQKIPLRRAFDDQERKDLLAHLERLRWDLIRLSRPQYDLVTQDLKRELFQISNQVTIED